MPGSRVLPSVRIKEQCAALGKSNDAVLVNETIIIERNIAFLPTTWIIINVVHINQVGPRRCTHDNSIFGKENNLSNQERFTDSSFVV